MLLGKKMIDPYDLLIKQNQELLSQKQMLLTLAASHNRLNAMFQQMSRQYSELLDAVESLTEQISKNDTQ
jgi:hypothetical protein